MDGLRPISVLGCPLVCKPHLKSDLSGLHSSIDVGFVLSRSCFKADSSRSLKALIVKKKVKMEIREIVEEGVEGLIQPPFVLYALSYA